MSLMKVLSKILGPKEYDASHESNVRFGITLLCFGAAALYLVFAVFYLIIQVYTMMLYCALQAALGFVLFHFCRRGPLNTYKAAYTTLCISVILLHALITYHFGECGTIFIAVAAILPNHLFKILKTSRQLLLDAVLILGVNITYWVLFNHTPLYEGPVIDTLRWCLINLTLLVCFFELYLNLMSQKFTDRIHQEQIKYTSKAAMIDALTNLGNRRQYNFIKEAIEKEGPQEGQMLFVAIMDIDFFKRINDKYGHAVGDQVLQYVARVLEKTFRKSDTLIRWGGEEFLMLFWAKELGQVLVLLERLRETLRTNPIHVNGNPVHVNVTIGIQGHDFSLSLDETIKKADEKMYRGKMQGRDRIIIL